MVARLKGEWEADYVHWQRRDLLARRYVCIWTDGVYPHAMALVRSHRGLRTLVMLKAARGTSRFVSQYEGAGEGTYNDHLPASPTPHVKVAPPRHARSRMKPRFPAIVVLGLHGAAASRDLVRKRASTAWQTGADHDGWVAPSRIVQRGLRGGVVR